MVVADGVVESTSTLLSGTWPALQVQLAGLQRDELQDRIEGSPGSTEDFASANEWEEDEEEEQEGERDVCLLSPLDGWECGGLLDLILLHYNQAAAAPPRRAEGGLSTISEGLTVDLVPEQMLEQEDIHHGRTEVHHHGEVRDEINMRPAGTSASTCTAKTADRPSLSGSSEGEDSSDTPLDEDAFSRPAAHNEHMTASVFVNGCW
jgi:hypothetical protein